MKRIILVAALLTLFCIAGASFGANNCNAQEKQIIRIGALLTLTGEWREGGVGAHKALVAGLDQVNHYLAPSGLRFELDVRNTAGNPQKALTELASLAKSGVRIVIGPQNSEEVQAVSQFAAAHSVLLVSPSATSPELSQKDNFFRVIPTDWNQADGLMKIMTAGKFSRFVVAYRSDAYGVGFNTQLQQAAKAYGIELVGSVALPQPSAGYAATVKALEQKLGVDNLQQTAMIFIGSAQDASGIIRDIPETSSLAQVKWFAGADIISSKELLADHSVAAFAARAEMEGLSIGYRGIALDVLPYINYALNGAADISPEALTSWDALWLIAETCRKNPSADIEHLKTGLKVTANQFRNSFGMINVMDENGDTRSARFMRYQIATDGKGQFFWQNKGHYANPVISAPFMRTITPRIHQEVGEIRIGALLSLSGVSAETGREVQAVLQEAVTCFNQYAATLGSNQEISLVVEDTGSNPQTAVLAAKKLISQGIQSFIGPLNSAELAAVAPLLDAPGLLSISPTSTAPSLSKIDHIYRLVMNDTYQAQALAALLKKDQINNVIVLYRNDLYGKDLTDEFRAAYPGTIQSLSYTPDTKDFGDLLKQAELLAAKADKKQTAILAISYDEIVNLVNLPAASPLYGVRWYGTDSTALSGALIQSKSAAQTAARLQFTALGYSAYGNYFDALYPVVNYRLANKIPHQLQESSLSAFDALWILGCAYLENGAADPAVIEKYVQNAAFRGLSGLVSMNANGDRSIGYYRIYRLEAQPGYYRWITTGLYSLDYAKKGVLELVR